MRMRDSFKKKSLLRRSLYLGCGFCDQGLEHILVVSLVGKRLADNDEELMFG